LPGVITSEGVASSWKGQWPTRSAPCFASVTPAAVSNVWGAFCSRSAVSATDFPARAHPRLCRRLRRQDDAY
jgi:hypothetical protein